MLDLFDSGHGPNSVPIFVYGTLRTHGALHDVYLSDCLVDSEHATARGFKLLTPEAGTCFPFLVPDDEEATQGEVMWVKRGPSFYRMIAMELNVGYQLELVDVEVNSLTEPLQAAAFVWHGRTAGMARVPHNDWMAT